MWSHLSEVLVWFARIFDIYPTETPWIRWKFQGKLRLSLLSVCEIRLRKKATKLYVSQCRSQGFLQKVSENKHCDNFFIKICLLSFPQAVIGQFNVFHFGINAASPFQKRKSSLAPLVYSFDRFMMLPAGQHSKAIPPFPLFLFFLFYDLTLIWH